MFCLVQQHNAINKRISLTFKHNIGEQFIHLHNVSYACGSNAASKNGKGLHFFNQLGTVRRELPNIRTMVRQLCRPKEIRSTTSGAIRRLGCLPSGTQNQLHFSHLYVWVPERFLSFLTMFGLLQRSPQRVSAIISHK